MRQTTYTGYVVCEPDAAVIPYTSSHKERRSAQDAAWKWAHDNGYTPTGGNCYRVDSPAGESIGEELDNLLADACTDWQLLDALELEPADTRGAAWYAREAGAPRRLLEAVAAAVHELHPNTEERDALEYAASWLQLAAACSPYPVATA